MTNPLLAPHELPPFSKITPEHVKEAIPYLIERNLKAVDECVLSAESPTWETVVSPLEQLDDELSQAWSPVSHLNAVANTPEWREVYQACLPQLVEYGTKIGQHQKLYEAYCALKKRPAFSSMSIAQQKVIEHAILDFQLSGVGLSTDERATFAKVSQELSMLQSKFQDNVMDATDAWSHTVEALDALAGLPLAAVALAKQAAEKMNLVGWRLTLDYPCYSAVMTYAKNRALRQIMHEAYATRASEQGPHAAKWDNTENMEKILALRHRLAQLLGYENFAAKSLVKKMAKKPEEVMIFLTNLAEKAKPYAQKEWEELQAFAHSTGEVETLAPWDIAYYSEQLRQKNYAISQEAVREYFPVPTVIAGLFEVAKRLYGIRIELVDNIDVWHPSVKFYAIFDRTGEMRGKFYLDLYARNQKRGGAWMDEARVRRRKIDHTLQLPVAYLVCNFREPVGDESSRLTHEEVITLFHEFGHGLHHLLTKMEYAPISGINGVPWDVVEVPSQFMENWCWQSEALAFISSHYQTNKPLPSEWLTKMMAARNFQSGLRLMRQLEFALLDFRIHLEYDPTKGGRISAILQEIRDAYGVIPAAPYSRVAHSFSHIFSGGYAAGYYSYLWAEQLACDAFSQFEEKGIFDPNTGRAFCEKVLAVGGSVEPATWFSDFRGRPPELGPFLKAHGLTRS